MARDKKVNVKITTNAKKASQDLKGLSKVFFNIKNLLISGLGILGIIKLLKTLTSAFGRQEDAVISLSTALRNNNDLTQENLDLLTKDAAALQQRTRFGDEAIIELQAELANFGMMSESIKENTRLTLDLATAKRINLVTAAQLVGKAFKGEFGTLSRYGIIIDQNIPKAEKFTEVQRMLSQQFGGAAEAAAKSYLGTVQQLDNAYGDLKEVVGENILETTDLTDKLGIATGAFKIITNWIKNKDDAEKESLETIQQYIDLTNEQRSALLKLSNSVVVKAFQEDLTENIREQIKLQKELDSLRTGGGAGIFGTIQQDIIDKQNEINDLSIKEARIRKQIKDLLLDPNVKKALTDKVTITKADTAATEINKKTLEAAAKAEIKRQEEILDKRKKSSSFRANLIRQRVQQESDAAKEEERIAIEKIKAILESDERITAIEKEAAQNRLNIIKGTLQKEISLRQSQLNVINQIETASLKKKLTDENVFGTERKVLLSDQEDLIIKLGESIATAGSATALQPLLEQLRTMNQLFRDVGDAEEITETLEEVNKIATQTIIDISKKKITLKDLVDITNMKPAARIFGKEIGTEIAAGLKEELKKLRFDDLNLNLKSSFLNNGG